MAREPTATPTGRRVASAVIHTALALAGFALTSVAFRALLPWPSGGGLAAKIAVMEQRKDEFDAVVIGSSRVAREYIPAVLEEELTRAGAPLRIFNLGVIGMDGFEADYVLRHIIALQPRRLRYAIIELATWRPDLPDPERVLTARSVHWHDIRNTLTALESIQLSRGPPALKREALLEQLELFALRAFNIGRGRWWVSEIMGGSEDADVFDVQDVRRHDGFLPHPSSRAATFDRILAHFAALGRPDPYEMALDSVRQMTSPDSTLDTYNVAAIDRQVATLGAADILAVYAGGPSVRARPYVGPLERAGHLPILIDFQDPEAWPELYDVRLRFDRDHLNQEGAELFSRLFARALAARLDEPGRP